MLQFSPIFSAEIAISRERLFHINSLDCEIACIFRRVTFESNRDFSEKFASRHFPLSRAREREIESEERECISVSELIETVSIQNERVDVLNWTRRERERSRERCRA
jgi:hypothetical protein